MTTPNVFISYSHEDEASKERLLTHLRVLEREGTATFWDTAQLTPGADWSEEIEQAVSRSDIAVLLISPSFLASDFVAMKELPALLERRHKEGLAIVPVLVRPSLWSHFPGIAELQFANDPSAPLSSLTDAKRDEAYASIAQRISDLVAAVGQRFGAREVTTAYATTSPSDTKLDPRHADAPGHLFVSHSKTDGDFAELLKLKLEREGHTAWIDSDRLHPGLDWRTEIDQAIRDTHALLAILSPEARASEYVTYEWAFAWGCGTKVIPIMLRQTTLHPRLATLQYLDFTNRLARPWNRLLDVLIKTAKNRSNAD
jgi:hypothetical protein